MIVQLPTQKFFLAKSIRWGRLSVGPRASSMAGFLLVLVVVSGCAEGRDWMDIGLPDQYAFAATVDGVTVAVDPWTDPSDMRAVFNKNLLSKDVVPIRIVIWNSGDHTVSFSSTQAKLHLGTHVVLSAMPISEVTKRIQVNESAAAAIIIILTGSYGTAVAEAISKATAEGNWKAQSVVFQSK